MPDVDYPSIIIITFNRNVFRYNETNIRRHNIKLEICLLFNEDKLEILILHVSKFSNKMTTILN